MRTPHLSGRYRIIIYILLSALIMMMISYPMMIIRVKNEVNENHAFFGKNFQSHTQSLNRLIFTLNDLLIFDEKSGKTVDEIIEEKEEMCRAVVSNSEYIHDLPPLVLKNIFDDDPLLLEKRLKEINGSYKLLLSEMKQHYDSLSRAGTAEEKEVVFEHFELTGRNLMDVLETQNHLLAEVNDYIFAHLQNDVLDISRILRSIITIVSIITIILTIVSGVYFFLTAQASKELRQAYDLLENQVKDRTFELEEANALLNSGNEAYHSIINSTMEGFWHVDIHGKILEVNNRYSELSGYIPDEILSMKISDFEAESASVSFYSAIHNIIQVGFGQFPTRHVRKDGTLWDLEVSCSYLPKNGGEVFVFLQDITHRKQIEEELKLGQRILADSQHLAKIGGWEWDIENQHMYWTAETYNIYGLDPELEKIDPALLFDKSLHGFSQEHQKMILDNYDLCVRDGVEKEFEAPFVNNHNQNMWVHTSFAPVKDGNQITKILGTIMDITERKKLQDEQLKMEKYSSLGVLAGGIAHDFNNLLTGIMGYAELLKMSITGLDQDELQYLDYIVSASIRGADLTTKLLAYGRKGRTSLSVVDIQSIIVEIAAILKSTIDKKISIIIAENADYSKVVGDNSSLYNVIMNLCINASQAMTEGGQIMITTKNTSLSQSYCKASVYEIEPGMYCEIEISDTGIGIPEENLKKIFEPFFTTKELGKGTGLGLSAVYGTIQDHHGEIHVQSDLGAGTVFRILLPCSDHLQPHV